MKNLTILTIALVLLVLPTAAETWSTERSANELKRWVRDVTDTVKKANLLTDAETDRLTKDLRRRARVWLTSTTGKNLREACRSFRLAARGPAINDWDKLIRMISTTACSPESMADLR